jgi:hypothetical protein
MTETTMTAEKPLRFAPTIEGLLEVVNEVRTLKLIAGKLPVVATAVWGEGSNIPDRLAMLSGFVAKITKGAADASIPRTIGFAVKLMNEMEEDLDQFFTSSVSIMTSTSLKLKETAPDLYSAAEEEIERVLGALTEAVNNKDLPIGELVGPYCDAYGVIVPLKSKADSLARSAERERTTAAKRQKTEKVIGQLESMLGDLTSGL